MVQESFKVFFVCYLFRIEVNIVEDLFDLPHSLVTNGIPL